MTIRTLLSILAISQYGLLIGQIGQSPSGTQIADSFIIRETIPASFHRGESVAVWSWGTLVSVKNGKSDSPQFQTLDKLGDTRTYTLPIPGARPVNVYSGRYTAGPDGSLAVAGSAYTDDSKAASFLALISRDGLQQKFVQISPFAPRTVTVASDGTVWMVGRELVAGKDPNPDHHILRRFDPTGRIVGSSIPRSTLKHKPEYTHPSEYSYLVSSKGRVGWYSEAVGTYMEFALDGTETGRFPTPRTIGMPGVALCDDGQVFVSTEYKTPSGDKGWGIHVLLRDGHTWLFLPRGGRWGMLLGCDGTKLVTTTDLSSITWLEPNKSELARFGP